MAPGPSKSGHTAGDLVAGSWASTEEPTPYPFTDLHSIQCSSVPRPSLPTDWETEGLGDFYHATSGRQRVDTQGEWFTKQ